LNFPHKVNLFIIPVFIRHKDKFGVTRTALEQRHTRHDQWIGAEVVGVRSAGCDTSGDTSSSTGWRRKVIRTSMPDQRVVSPL
jgi:uncharacterized protein (UPF0264 family)